MKTKNWKKILSAGILFILVGSISANVFLAINLKKYYSLLYEVELDPLGLSQFPEESLQPATKPVVVFFGDSRAAQWTSPEMENFTFINRGVGNQTSSQVANRFDEHVKPLRPKVIIIQVGINDLKTIPLFPERKQEIISNCKDNIQKIIQASLAIDSKVIVTTVFPVGKVSFPRILVWSNDIDEGMRDINNYILNLTDNDLIVFDTAGVLSNDEGKTKPEYKYDLLHLNNIGYQALNPELVKILETIK